MDGKNVLFVLFVLSILVVTPNDGIRSLASLIQ